MESTGIQAIGIHGRRKDERPRHNNNNDVIKAIAQAITIPVIAK
jgi:tRNA-dihydrouridine synthase 2